MSGETQAGKKYLQSSLIKDHPEYIKSYNSIIKGKKHFQKAKDLNWHFTKEDVQIVNKNMKQCSTSSTIKQMQVEPQWYTITHPPE